jgi:hypothetical protein
MPNFKTDGWSYDPTCATSPSGAHYWMVTIGNHGRCKHCDMEQLFQVKTTNGPSPSTKAYSIRGGQTAAKRGK